jgi:nicotinamide-nucleotide amidase
MKSEIIAVGSEMLTPFRQDTNSLYLTEKLNEIGVTVAFKTIVGDRRKDLVSAIRTASRPHRHSHPHGRPRPH